MKAGIVLLGGVIAAGKTSLASSLVARHNFIRVSTRSFLEKRAHAKGLNPTRSVLQQMGDELDDETGGVWVLERIEVAFQDNPSATRFLLDSARRDFQIRHARRRWPARVFYVHLIVPIEVARNRYDERRRESLESDISISFDEAKRSPTEQHAETLSAFADLLLDTNAVGTDMAADRVADRFHDILRTGE